jgi:hypothetical protein
MYERVPIGLHICIQQIFNRDDEISIGICVCVALYPVPSRPISLRFFRQETARGFDATR